MSWGACALPAELYPADLPCVHQVPALHSQSPSTFFHESHLSWTVPQDTPAYTATHNPTFAGDNPSFQSLVEDREDKDAQDKEENQSSDSSTESVGQSTA